MGRTSFANRPCSLARAADLPSDYVLSAWSTVPEARAEAAAGTGA